jgi:hypothetical protein
MISKARWLKFITFAMILIETISIVLSIIFLDAVKDIGSDENKFYSISQMFMYFLLAGAIVFVNF